MSEQDHERQKGVLVCGCDAQIADRVSAVLSDCSIERASGDDAVFDAIRCRPVDLIVTAREKSAKLAIELLRRINQAGPEANPRVIMLTTESSREDVIAAMRLR